MLLFMFCTFSSLIRKPKISTLDDDNDAARLIESPLLVQLFIIIKMVVGTVALHVSISNDEFGEFGCSIRQQRILIESFARQRSVYGAVNRSFIIMHRVCLSNVINKNERANDSHSRIGVCVCECGDTMTQQMAHVT